MSNPTNNKTTTKELSKKKLLTREKFEGAWLKIRDELLAFFDSNGMPAEAREWYKRVSDYDQFSSIVYLPVSYRRI